ncbi:MAG: exodeoxyribonuclease V subunit beta [Denitrovibrio sp.]|nr:MAG: exodeoxyribonuclease V subunit beta [Denitrovibrio sp.]
MKQELELLKAPLTGTNLIEANAGTGKTYNITGLFVRMIIEKQYSVESILVVTYTKAAVSDLKAKIYRRLLAVRDAILSRKDGTTPPDDPFACEYADERAKSAESDLKLIKYAIRDFDQCSVFTIHGFCQRMLKESAFSGKIPYDVELSGDIREIIKKPVYDFWRKNFYSADKAVIPRLAKESPDGLVDFYMQVSSSLSAELIRPEKEISEQEVADNAKYIEAAFGVISKEWKLVREEVTELLDPANPNYPLNRNSYSIHIVERTLAIFEKKILENRYTMEDSDGDLIRLTQSNVTKSLKKGHSLDHSFFEIFENWYKDAEEFNTLTENYVSGLKYRLCDYMDSNLEKHKLNNNMQSYDDLITRMRDAVCTDGSSMANTLYSKYMAALIDEFQDTDPYQYDIFNIAFGKKGRPFFMIGDPKQAIYSFRGADVYAYLKASKSGGDKYTLTQNYRSDSNLVESVNKFFDKENSFLMDDISYKPSRGDKNYRLNVNGKTYPPMTIWNAEKTTAQQIAGSTARHIAELLNTSASGNASLDGKPVQPSDIAVLCRSRKQMIMVKEALADCLVPAVMSGSESVFDSVEAMELISVLQAVISPFSQKAVKTAMATSLFGYNANDIHGITETEEWDRITEEFRSYNDLINMKGFAPMFFSLAASRRLFEKTAATKNGERKLTNLIHLSELAQRHEADRKASPSDILKWMKEKMTQENGREEEAELKMDSDENAVTIITIFKSKGLEYNIVYTPFLMFPSGSNPRVKNYPKYHKDEKYYLDITDSQQSKDYANDEKMAEDLRIAYVALTRANSVCFTAWGEAKESYKTSIAKLINGEYEKYDPTVLKSFASETGIRVCSLPENVVQTYTNSKEKPKTAGRTFSSVIPYGWQINSFSRLIHSSSAGVKDTDQFTAQEKQEETSRFDIFSFPKGAKAGTFLHECMENIYFENYSKFSVLDTVHEKLEKYSFDQSYAPAVADNLISIIEKDVAGINLSKLKKGQYIPEMEFHISTGKFSSADISDIFEKSGEDDFAKAASTLSFSTMQGFMNGFADLIFQQNGKYWVLDWKSNHLGSDIHSYSFEKMHAEMLGSHYYMQMHIYILALHMHLKKLIPHYSFDTHIGGGLYLFMRGVNSLGTEGFYLHSPKGSTIEELEKLVKRP